MKLDQYIIEHKKSSAVPVNGLHLIVMDGNDPSGAMYDYTVKVSPSEKYCDIGKYPWSWPTGLGPWASCKRIEVIECLDPV